MHYGLVRRFLTKLIHDIVPGALASLIGGFLLTHYGLYGFGRPPEPAAVQSAPASVAMMDLLRDEHALMANFVKAAMATEYKEAVTDDADAAPPNETAAAPASIAAPRSPAAATAVKGTVTHGKAPVVVASLPPLVIAQLQPSEGARPAANHDGVFFTEAIQNRVVAATQRAVAVIGGIPSWFGAIGDRIGGESNVPRPPADLVSAS